MASRWSNPGCDTRNSVWTRQFRKRSLHEEVARCHLGLCGLQAGDAAGPVTVACHGVVMGEKGDMARTAWLVGCIVALAGLDLVGALLAQQYAQRHLPLTLATGAVTFVVLFLVYAFSLNYAQLSIVTMSWIVLLQVGLVVIDVVYAQLHLDRKQALALVVILALQCYLIISTQSPSPTAGPSRSDGLSVPAPAPFFELGDGSAPPPQQAGALLSVQRPTGPALMLGRSLPQATPARATRS